MQRRNHLMLVWAVVSAALLTSASPGQAAGLIRPRGRLGGRVQMQSHQVSVHLRREVAVTEVHLVLQNLEDRAVEAQYYFPLPADATISDFTMWIQGREVIGEVIERGRAASVYRDYKPKDPTPPRKDPGLVEQLD